ncbi:MAG: hypothetical protein LBT27_02230, partial [Prevotellaceae bacterium]|nr:hypothetical protein [Prevotellaceae bacterium]
MSKTTLNNNEINMRHWWYNIRNLFSIQAEISLVNFVFAINIFSLKLNIRTDFPDLINYWINIYNKIINLTENKTAELQLTFAGNLITGISIFKKIHSDHTPLNIEISILGFTFIFTIYDNRHWDDEINSYQKYETILN